MLTGDVCTAKLISKKSISNERALHEYTLLSSIRHQSIVRVFQFIETNPFSIIISELVHGRLFDYLCTQSIIVEDKIAKYIRQLFEALNYLQQCKIVHLDIQVNKNCFYFFIELYFVFKFSRKIFLFKRNSIKLNFAISAMPYVYQI